MEKSINVKDIMAFNGKRSFRYLHERFGFDFEGNIGIFRVDGKFTVNSIGKLVSAHGFSADAMCVVLMTNSYLFENRTRYSQFAIAQLFFNDNRFTTPCVCGFGTYWRKADFNEDRKMDESIAFVIVQEWANLKHYKNKRNMRTYFERFAVKEVEYDDDGVSVDSLLLMDETGDTFRHCVYVRHTLREVIDGTGYLKLEYREELNKRLKAWKEQKAKDAYSAVDNSGKIAVIDALVAAKKLMLVETFKSASSYKDICEFEDRLSSFRWACGDAEEFKRKTAKKAYSSVEQSERVYNDIVKRLSA